MSQKFDIMGTSPPVNYNPEVEKSPHVWEREKCDIIAHVPSPSFRQLQA
jgi:hypothetical protein